MGHLYNKVDGLGKRKIDRTYTDTWQTRSIVLDDISYAEYLKSEEWQRIKRKALKREFYSKCLKCGATENLELHHRSYKWIGTKSAMQGLVPLCRTHHQQIHDYAKANKVSVRVATNTICKEEYLKIYNSNKKAV